MHSLVDQTFVLLLLLTLCSFGDLPFSRSDILKSSPKSNNLDRRVFLFSLVFSLQLVVGNFWGFVKKSTMSEMLVLINRLSVKFLDHPTVPMLRYFQFKKMLKSSEFCSIINFRRVNHAHKLCTCQNNPSQNKNYPTNSLN